MNQDLRFILNTNGGNKSSALEAYLKGPYSAILLLFLFLIAAGNMFRSLPLERTLEFWSIWPPLLLPTWLDHWNEWDLFLWIKTFSLIPVTVIWCTCIRFNTIDPKWTRLGSFFVLSVNILEAVTADLVSKRGKKSWSPLNAVGGFLLIYAEIPSLKSLRIIETEPYDVLWHLGTEWIIAYTIWNWMFVYNNYPYAIGRHTAVLLAPLVLTLRDGFDTWVEARGYTLAFYMMFRATFYKPLRYRTDVRDPIWSESHRLCERRFKIQNTGKWANKVDAKCDMTLS
eukprot:scaffold111456_cov52-Attheya_sp.AAC.4